MKCHRIRKWGDRGGGGREGGVLGRRGGGVIADLHGAHVEAPQKQLH